MMQYTFIIYNKDCNAVEDVTIQLVDPKTRDLTPILTLFDYFFISLLLIPHSLKSTYRVNSRICDSSCFSEYTKTNDELVVFTDPVVRREQNSKSIISC